MNFQNLSQNTRVRVLINGDINGMKVTIDEVHTLGSLGVNICGGAAPTDPSSRIAAIMSDPCKSLSQKIAESDDLKNAYNRALRSFQGGGGAATVQDRVLRAVCTAINGRGQFSGKTLQPGHLTLTTACPYGETEFKVNGAGVWGR